MQSKLTINETRHLNLSTHADITSVDSTSTNWSDIARHLRAQQTATERLHEKNAKRRTKRNRGV
jgi:hypothetical protein